MSSELQVSVTSLHLVGIEELKRRWGWFVALGILLVVLGVIALGAATLVSLVTVIFFGWLMIFGGLLETIHAFATKGWSGFFIDLLTGLLYFIIGLMFVFNPSASAEALTLLIAMFLIFEGVFRIVVAVTMAFHGRVWLFINGVISLILGVAIWRQWPLDGLWVIGLFIGIDMIFNGWTLIMLGIAAKSLRPGDQLAPPNAPSI